MPEQRPGVRAVVESARAPARLGHQQRHGEVFLAVRRGALGVVPAVQAHGPGQVARVRPGLQQHVALGEAPELVEQRLAIHLHAHHHAVAHALGSGVVVAGVLQAAAVGVHVPVDPLLGIEKQRLKGALGAQPHRRGVEPRPFEQIRAMPLFKRVAHGAHLLS